MPLNIRRATSADIPVVCDIDTVVFRPNGTAEDHEVIRARFQAFPEGFLVAEIDDKIVGYASCEKWATLHEPKMNENPLETHDPHGTILCVTAMAVVTDRQNQGIGTKLLGAVALTALNHRCSRIVLETVNASAFYRKHGYTILQERYQYGARLFVMASNQTS